MSYIGTEHTYWRNLKTGAALDIENTVELSLKPNVKSVDIPGRSPETVGSLIRQVNRPDFVDFTATIDAFSPRLFATQLMGSVSKINEAGNSVTDELHYPIREEGLLLNFSNIDATSVAIACENATGGSGFTVNGALNAGDTVITVDGTTSGDIAIGDVVKFGTSEYKYRITAVALTGTNPAQTGTFTIAEGLIEAVADGAAVTHVASYAVDVDYTISTLQAKSGFIQFTDKVPSSDKKYSLGVLKVSYDYKGMICTEIQGGTVGQLELFVRGRVFNDSENSDGLLEIYHANCAASDKFDWASDTKQEIKLAGKLVTPTGYTSPFRYLADVLYN